MLDQCLGAYNTNSLPNEKEDDAYLSRGHLSCAWHSGDLFCECQNFGKKENNLQEARGFQSRSFFPDLDIQAFFFFEKILMF
mmetsp:Transcript_19125/g.44564  ORF Transcript_19125/g.44564 Transcript_19125/m.44564 type:complete len:82 (-) Transcript_19125:686-931(-)